MHERILRAQEIAYRSLELIVQELLGDFDGTQANNIVTLGSTASFRDRIGLNGLDERVDGEWKNIVICRSGWGRWLRGGGGEGVR